MKKKTVNHLKNHKKKYEFKEMQHGPLRDRVGIRCRGGVSIPGRPMFNNTLKQ